MTIVEVTAKVTHKSLMNKTKSELAYKVLDELDRAERLEAMVDRMSETTSECVLLIRPMYDLCQQIEICGASVELTKAVTMAGDVMHKLMDATGVQQLPPEANSEKVAA
jgi:hypothetical protein